MAITWNTPVDYNGVTKPTYEGAVIRLFSKVERVMSDVYATIFYAVVWAGPGAGVINVAYGNDEFGSDGVATVDATLEALEQVKVHVAAEVAAARVEMLRQEMINQEKRAWEAVQAARAFVFSIRKDVRVKTIARRGRGAPALGTEGVVFWMGTSGFGTDRLGFKTDAGETVWTTLNNCQAIVPGYDFDVEPSEGWVAVASSMKAAAAAAAPRSIPVGTKVVLEDGYTGLVFWTKGGRCGAKTDPRNRNEEPRWFNSNEVQATA